MRAGFSRFILCAPFFVALAIFWLFPLVESVRLSLHSDTLYGESAFVGLENFAELLSDDRFWKAVRNTALFTLATSCLSIVIAFLLAQMIRAAWPGLKGPMTFVFMLPGLCPPTVMAFLFLLVFHGDAGLLNKWLVTPLGFDAINWLSDPQYILAALVLQSVWRWSGFMAFFIGCAIDALPRSALEAAELDGAGGWARSWHITLPMIVPTLVFCLLYLGIDCVSQFAGSYVLLGGSGGTADAGLLLVSYAYQRAFTFGEFGSAAAVALSSLPFVAGLLLLLAFAPRSAWKGEET